jgi:hypothetical protein
MHSASFYTEKKLRKQRIVFTTSFYAAEQALTHSNLLHTAAFEAFIHTRQNLLTSLITIAALMQPLQCDLRCPAAKNTCIMHVAAALSNLEAAITIRSAETQLHCAAAS